MFARRKQGRTGWGIFTRERRPRNTARPKRLRRIELLERRQMPAAEVSGAVEGVWNLAGSAYMAARWRSQPQFVVSTGHELPLAQKW